MGRDIRIDPTAKIKYDFISGSHVSIDMCVYCAVNLHVGNWVHIAPHVCIIGGGQSSLTIGSFAGISIGGKVVCGSEDFVNSLLGFMPDEYKIDVYGNNIIKDFAWAGVGSIIMPNIVMAEGSVLGAGAVLTKDTEPWMVYVGVPARPVKMRNKDLILENAYKLGYEKGKL